jgi:putative transposase
LIAPIFPSAGSADKHFSWDLFAGHLKDSMEEFLNSVLVECQSRAIGASWHERSSSRADYRNGYRIRTLATVYGQLTLKVPRNRCCQYLQGVFDAFSRRTAELEQRILDAFGLGLSTRGLSRWLRSCRIPLSPQGVANIVAQADSSMRAWHQRSLPDDRWQVVFLDGLWVRLGGSKRVVLVAVGLVGEVPEIIDYRVAKAESSAAWDGFLRNLYQRGLEGKATELFVSDGGNAIEAAIAEAFPGKPHQLCAFHKLQDIAEHLEDWHRRKAVLADAAKIYRAPSARAALRRAKRWAQRWQDKEPLAVRLFMQGLQKTFVYYKSPKELWRKVRTTNVVERYLREVRRKLKNICAYRNEQSIDRMVFATINGIAARGYPYNHKNLFTHNP